MDVLVMKISEWSQGRQRRTVRVKAKVAPSSCVLMRKLVNAMVR